MPYSSLSEARIKKIDGLAISLDQINAIATMADAIGENGWPIAISSFRKSHAARNGSWVKTGNDKEDMIQEVYVQKEGDRYKITAVSTAALKDHQGETFDTKAMDYEIAHNAQTGKYPEFRLFHSPATGFGLVTKMKRVGIFAIDEGYSYDDAFSHDVCEKMLTNNPGKWRISRGFYVLEAAGGCPTCSEKLILKSEHMLVGFRCPTCQSIHVSYRGVLKDLHFRKTRTFDITVTDKPCVPWTGVVATRVGDLSEDNIMKKEDLRKRLIDAGLDVAVIDAKLATVSDEYLKELDDLPEAAVLKEFEDEDAPGDQVFVLDPDVLKEFTAIVKKEIVEALDGFTIDIPDQTTEIELKELPALTELLAIVKELSAKVDALVSKDEQRLKEKLDGMPRTGRLRITRFKAAKPDADEEDVDEEDVDEEEDVKPRMMKKNKSDPDGANIVSGDGFVAANMTEFITK